VKRLTVLAFGMALFAAGCGASSQNSDSSGSNSGAKETGPIVIGEAIGLSGAMEYFDVPASTGAKIAIEEINKAGGVNGRKIKLVTGDHQSDANQGTQAAQRVIDQGAKILLTSCNYENAAAAARLANSKKMLVFSYCAGEPQFSRQSAGGVNKYTFDMGQETNGVGASMAQFAYGKGWRKVYVLCDTWINYTKQMCKFFKDSWKGLGGTSIVGEDSFINTDTSVAGQIAKIKSAGKYDAVILATVLPGGTTPLRQLRAAGIDAPVVTGDGMDSADTPKAIPNLSNFYESVVASTYGDDPNPKVNAFFDTFTKRSGQAPDGSYAIFGYSIIEALKKAIEDSGGSTNGDDLKAALEKFQDVPLLVGPMSFTSQQHVFAGRPEKIIGFTNGKPGYVATVEPKNIPPAF
jgi:branched-chain amino acid transport system substrate-binding protein